MENIIIIAVLAVVLGLALAYVIKAKKTGQKCIGCPNGGSCQSKNCSSSYGCGEKA